MIFLLMLALVALSLATAAVIRYALPARILGRALLFAWFVGVTVIILLICWGMWTGLHAGFVSK